MTRLEKRRCLLPVDGFFEWEKVVKETGEAFTLVSLRENSKNPESGWGSDPHHHHHRRFERANEGAPDCEPTNSE
jgi:hypothetical protein